MGLFTGSAGETSVGALATLWSLVGIVYILGNVLFGIATFRGGILSRWAAALLGLGAVSCPAFALLSQSFAPLAAGRRACPCLLTRCSSAVEQRP